MIIFKKKIAGLTAASLGRFVLRARRAAKLPGKVNLLVTGRSEMHALNLQFRKKDKATDVLSFPSNASGEKSFAGEIAISADIARENAAALGHSVAVEVKILALHGILHLAGFDHERDNGKMARKEAELRKEFGLPSSLTERGASKTRRLRNPQRPAPSIKARRTA